MTDAIIGLCQGKCGGISMEFIPALLFVLSSGLLFQSRFRENLVLVLLAGLIALVSTYFLVVQIATFSKVSIPQSLIALLSGSTSVVPQPLPKKTALNSTVADGIRQAEDVESDARKIANDAEIKSKRALTAARLTKAKVSNHSEFSVRNEAGLTINYDGEVDGRGVADGVGVMDWSNGDLYCGEFRGNQVIGLGKYKTADGTTMEGMFVNSNLQGSGIKIFKSGETQYGHFLSNSLETYGSDVFPDGSVWKGFWHAGHLNGVGAKFDATGG